ncbi:MAG: ABC transporter permease [Deltaproteobacteria bacterium]|jgi:peptide/nickel transport system permease protein|nr:MAG: ABC transporter permease [Deltaproteobacteria bacterium]
MLFKRLIRNKLAVLGALLLLFLITVALLAPWVATHNPLKMNIKERLQPPSQTHFFGTDGYGRDLFSRVVYGAAIALKVGFLSIAVAMSAGIILGLISGYYRGWIDAIIMRIMDAILSFPIILLAIGIMAVLGAGFANLMIALGLVYTPRFARLVRSSVLSIREKEYIEAARVTGCSDFTILFVHILPNCWAPVIIQATISFGYAILWEAALSFLGLGAPPPSPSWGSLLADGKEVLTRAPWMTYFPGLAIAMAVLALNLFGDGLRDVLDPRIKE